MENDERTMADMAMFEMANANEAAPTTDAADDPGDAGMAMFVPQGIEVKSDAASDEPARAAEPLSTEDLADLSLMSGQVVKDGMDAAEGDADNLEDPAKMALFEI